MISASVCDRSIPHIDFILFEQLFLYLFGELAVMYVDDASDVQYLLGIQMLPQPPHHGIVQEQVALVVHLFHCAQHSHELLLVPLVVLYHFMLLPIDISLV